jgi:hypothetical protein
MTRDELITQIQAEVKGLSASLSSDDYSNAVDAAERDTGWALPQTADFQIKWLLSRSKRHLFFYLLSESAAKFRFKAIYLQHKFEHYRSLVADMDKSFAKAQEDFAFEFAGVSAYEIAGTKIDAGFSSEPLTGRDTTYDENNQVMIHPNENS